MSLAIAAMHWALPLQSSCPTIGPARNQRLASCSPHCITGATATEAISPQCRGHTSSFGLVGELVKQVLGAANDCLSLLPPLAGPGILRCKAQTPATTANSQ